MKERRRDKEEEKKQDRTSALGREKLKERRGSHTRGSPLTDGEISEDRRGDSGAIRGECSNRSVAGWSG